MKPLTIAKFIAAVIYITIFVVLIKFGYYA